MHRQKGYVTIDLALSVIIMVAILLYIYGKASAFNDSLLGTFDDGAYTLKSEYSGFDVPTFRDSKGEKVEHYCSITKGSTISLLSEKPLIIKADSTERPTSLPQKLMAACPDSIYLSESDYSRRMLVYFANSKERDLAFIEQSRIEKITARTIEAAEKNKKVDKNVLIFSDDLQG